jgi:hypothetical protein
MLAVSRGRIICLTTPAGTRGFFHREWSEGEGWSRFRVSAEQCPRISPEFLADELKTLGPLAYAQEYQLEFLDDALSVFPSELIDGAISEAVEVLHV